jgi:hypothetical protein
MEGVGTTFQHYIALIAVSIAILVIINLVWSIIVHSKLSKLKRRNQEIFADSNIKNLEDILANQSKSIKSPDREIQELYNISNQINNLSFRGIHKIGMIRFNPFNDVGGDQSFSLALLNGKNNGVVISTLYSREGTRIYAKSVVAAASEKYPLTEEEKQAIKIALTCDPKKVN